MMSLEFATRDTFVGLKGDFGQARVGRFDSPFKAARGPVNFFGDMVGDIRNVTRVGDNNVLMNVMPIQLNIKLLNLVVVLT